MNIEFPSSWLQPITPGFGTFPWPHITKDHDYVTVARMMQDAIEDALTIGYRHLDTAFAYCNQDQVGMAIKAVGIPRRDVFVTSKLDQNSNEYEVAQIKIKQAIKQIWGLQATPSERYLDAFLIHYPGKGHPLSAWKALQEAKDQGIVKHIGVSNFEIWHLEEMVKKTGQLPEINQIEFHPWIYNEQRELLMYCHEHGIAVEGYSPLAQGLALDDSTLLEIANRHNTAPTRVLLKWCMQHGVRPIIGSRNKIHLHRNAEPYKFQLDADEMLLLDEMCISRKIHISRQWNWDPKKATLGDEA